MTPRLFFLVLVAFLTLGAASAHDSRPLVVTVKESGSTATLDWRAPPTVEAANAPVVRLAPPCRESAAPSPGLAGRAVYVCPDGVSSVSIAYGFFNPSLSTILRFERRGAPAETTMLPPEALSWAPDPAPRLATVAASYFKLGVHHIVIGVDHILFLCGLLILSGTLPRMLMTVTGFTLAHSVTLALVALGALRVSTPAVEATIALSIVFVAAEIARGNRATLAWRRPIIVASTFGLLHGAGFAAALGEIGIPQTERFAALLFFNVGVEAGQLVIIAAVLAAVGVLRRLRAAAQRRPVPFPRQATQIAGYALGIMSAFWLFERVAAAL